MVSWAGSREHHPSSVGEFLVWSILISLSLPGHVGSHIRSSWFGMVHLLGGPTGCDIVLVGVAGAPYCMVLTICDVLFMRKFTFSGERNKGSKCLRQDHDILTKMS